MWLAQLFFLWEPMIRLKPITIVTSLNAASFFFLDIRYLSTFPFCACLSDINLHINCYLFKQDILNKIDV